MSMRADRTRYPFPDLPDYPKMPAEPPWSSPISDLSGLWLIADCDCGNGVRYPIRRMAADIGWKVTLRHVVDRLRCTHCDARPSSVRLVLRGDEDGKSIAYGRSLRLR